MNRDIALKWWLSLVLITVSGCAGRNPFLQGGETIDQKPSLPIVIWETPANGSGQPAQGSLWPGANTKNMFFTDNKARSVNDIVTIEIVESSSASKNATTKLGRSSNLSASATGLFGIETKQNARLGRAQTSNAAGTSNRGLLDLANILNAKTQNDFDGSGTTTRSGTLSGKMTALVKEVLPNGNLRIQGKRMVTVNGEEQVMVLAGLIRPEDIDSNNVVLSTFIADAKISYYGMGVIADKQNPGWLARGFDKFWPF